MKPTRPASLARETAIGLFTLGVRMLFWATLIASAMIALSGLALLSGRGIDLATSPLVTETESR